MRITTRTIGSLRCRSCSGMPPRVRSSPACSTSIRNRKTSIPISTLWTRRSTSSTRKRYARAPPRWTRSTPAFARRALLDAVRAANPACRIRYELGIALTCPRAGFGSRNAVSGIPRSETLSPVPRRRHKITPEYISRTADSAADRYVVSGVMPGGYAYCCSSTPSADLLTKLGVPPELEVEPDVEPPRTEQGIMNPVKALEQHGQSVWLDFLARGFVVKGELKRLIDNDGVKGVTSNPSIFEKAIGSSNEYDSALAKALKNGDRPIAELFEILAVEDIQHAADVLRPVHDRLKGTDGFVSLEVSPYLAMDTKGTIAEAKRLWKHVNRKNLMVKVPATPEGLPAIQHLISEGISINITLLFSRKVYGQVAEAYLAGLEKYAGGGGDPCHVASVASFFVSRIDTAADKLLDEKFFKAKDTTEKERLAALKGKVAIANAKLAYQEYKHLFAGPRWEKLKAKGAMPQRLLWASTGTKNKDYSDVLYVEELIGADTINTMPPATLEAFRDHGKVRDSLEENIEDARRVLAELERSGISLDAITADLVKDGVKLFADAADRLYGAVAYKRAAVLGGGIDRQALALGSHIGKAVEEATEDWRASGKIRRLWQHDRAERDEGLFLRAGFQGDRRRQGRSPLHRGDRSRLVVGEGRNQTRFCTHLPRRSNDRWTLLRAVAIRAGARRDRGHRPPLPLEACARDGALLRTGRAAARESRRAARPRHGSRRSRRTRQGDDPVVEEGIRFRRLGRTADRGIHRQGRQGPDPDRRRTAWRGGAVWTGPVLHRHQDRRRKR